MVEAVVTVGGYAMVSRFLVALEVPPPDGEVAGLERSLTGGLDTA